MKTGGRLRFTATATLDGMEFSACLEFSPGVLLELSETELRKHIGSTADLVADRFKQAVSRELAEIIEARECNVREQQKKARRALSPSQQALYRVQSLSGNLSQRRPEGKGYVQRLHRLLRGWL